MRFTGEALWWGRGGLGTAALASGRAEHRSRETNEQTETQIRDKTIEKYTSISSDGEEAGLWDGHRVHSRVPSGECGGNEMAPHCFKSDSVSLGEVDTDSRGQGARTIN